MIFQVGDRFRFRNFDFYVTESEPIRSRLEIVVAFDANTIQNTLPVYILRQSDAPNVHSEVFLFDETELQEMVGKDLDWENERSSRS